MQVAAYGEEKDNLKSVKGKNELKIIDSYSYVQILQLATLTLQIPCFSSAGT